MTTDLTTLPQHLPRPTPELAQSLSPPQLEEHRTKIASEVRIVLSAYFQPHETEEIKSGQLAWWCDSLEDWKREQVVYALRKWNEQNPRLRPTPGDIVKLLKDARGKAEAERMRLSKPAPEPQSAVVTDEERERRKRIVDEVMSGYREKE